MRSKRFRLWRSAAGVSTIDVTCAAEWFFSPDPDYLVLEYYVIGSAPDDATRPYLRLYGDGRVHVHRSQHRTKPGDYTIQLSDTELNGVLQTLVRHCVMEFDSATVKNEVKRAHDEHVARTGTYPFATDGTAVSLEINLELYIPAGTGEPIENFHHRVSWSDVEHTAELYPNLEALQGLRTAIHKLDALAERAAHQPWQ